MPLLHHEDEYTPQKGANASRFRHEAAVDCYEEEPPADLAALLGLGARLRQLREGATPPLSQAELGRRVGVSQSHIARLEAGRRGLPSPDLLQSLAFALATTSADLLCAAGYLPAPTHWSIGEAIERASYRRLLRMGELVQSEEAREYIALAIKVALTRQNAPGLRPRVAH